VSYVRLCNLELTYASAFFNDVTYVSPKVPTLYTVLSTGPNATNPTIYGSNTNAFVLAQNEVVEIVLNNDDPGKCVYPSHLRIVRSLRQCRNVDNAFILTLIPRHPFHLHGHAFQVVTRSEDDAGFYDPTNTTTPPSTPMRRDTVLVRPNGHIVLRFRSDNPGKHSFPRTKTNIPTTTLSMRNPILPPTDIPPRRLALPLPHRMARSLRANRHNDRSPSRRPSPALAFFLKRNPAIALGRV